MVKKFIILFITSLELCLNSCSFREHKLGYESDEDTLEYESKEIDNDCNTTVEGIEILEDSNTTSLTEIYSNNKFSIRYPSNWEVVQENARATDNTTITVQIMQRGTNEYDFKPNVNIIVSKDKRIETTNSLATTSYNQAKELGFATNLIGIHNCQINGKKGSVAEYIAAIEGYRLHIYQYIVKKKDNSTFVITMTLDHNNLREQKSLSQQIIDSIKIF